MEAVRDITYETKRSNFTSYMAEIGSRQEEAPLLGLFLGHAKLEPLHGKNNLVKEFTTRITNFNGDDPSELKVVGRDLHKHCATYYILTSDF